MQTRNEVDVEQTMGHHVDVQALMDYEFQYSIWYRGHSRSLKHQRHELIDSVIQEFLKQTFADEHGACDPFYVFRDAELWLTIRVTSHTETGGQIFRAYNHWLKCVESLTLITDETAPPTRSERRS